MNGLLYAFPGNEAMAAALAAALDAETGRMELRRFPDGESYVRLDTSPRGRDVVLVCSLDQPDAKSLAVYFAAATARELGATRVGLVAPYLGYLRQDARFRPGEAITSIGYARWLSQFLDWLATVDPHLHRHASLGAVYSIATAVAESAPAIARWVAAHVPTPLLIGPDAESAQWVARVAAAVACPFVVARKERGGDFDVHVSLPDLASWRERTPVLVDDIVSTGRTLIATFAPLRAAGLRQAPVCIGVHALFAADADAALRAAGAGVVVSANTVRHASNAIDVAPELAAVVRDLLRPSAAAAGAGRSSLPS